MLLHINRARHNASHHPLTGVILASSSVDVPHPVALQENSLPLVDLFLHLRIQALDAAVRTQVTDLKTLEVRLEIVKGHPMDRK